MMCDSYTAARSLFSALHKGRSLAQLENGIRARRGEQMHPTRNDSGPTGLVACAEAGAGVAMKVLVELDAVAPIRIFLEFHVPCVYRAPPFFILQEDVGK